jgi:hypothetical protein
MNESMIERVARAHYARTIEIVAITHPGAPFFAWDRLPEEQRRLSVAGARAAIEAMREPTWAIIRAADRHNANQSIEDFRDQWSDMIDAALAEHQASPKDKTP